VKNPVEILHTSVLFALLRDEDAEMRATQPIQALTNTAQPAANII